jgi:cytoskeletal protein RodZ
MPKASKGLLGSKWASDAFPASPSPTSPKYPDPSTLEPVYRSEDWLSDLSAEYKALSVKTKNASETQPTPASPATQPAGVQTAAQTAKPFTSESRHLGQDTVKSSDASQGATSVQPAGRAVAPDQTSGTNAGPSAELGHSATSAQSVSDQGGIFNDSAFKDWYNSQFMRRKA